MNPRSLFAMQISAVLCGALCLPSTAAVGQSAADIVGSYALVSATNTQAGKTIEQFGPTPKGMLVLDANGRYVAALMRHDLPKFASNNRSTGTADEYRSVARGSFTHFGKYAVTGGHIVFRLEHSTFPNWDGQEQKRVLTVSGDELRYTLTSTIGGISTIV